MLLYEVPWYRLCYSWDCICDVIKTFSPFIAAVRMKKPKVTVASSLRSNKKVSSLVDKVISSLYLYVYEIE